MYTVKDRPLPSAKLSCSVTKCMAFPTSSQKKARAVQYPQAGQGLGWGNLCCLAEVMFIVYKQAHLKSVFMQ